MSNVNRIFGLFDDGKDSTPPQEVHIDFMETPDAKLGMFIKLIQNNIVFNQKLKNFFKKVGEDFNEHSTKQSSEFTVFNRAWFYIKDINIDIDNHLYAVVKQDTYQLLDSLKLSLSFFEKLEEYEKCAHLHKIYKIVNRI